MPMLAIRSDFERGRASSLVRACIANALEGMSRADAARLAGMDRRTLRGGVLRYNEAGVEGSRVQLLILDDWGLSPLNDLGRHDLLKILEHRYGRRTTLVTSQLPVADWQPPLAISPMPTPSWTARSTTRTG